MLLTCENTGFTKAQVDGLPQGCLRPDGAPSRLLALWNAHWGLRSRLVRLCRSNAVFQRRAWCRIATVANTHPRNRRQMAQKRGAFRPPGRNPAGFHTHPPAVLQSRHLRVLRKRLKNPPPYRLSSLSYPSWQNDISSYNKDMEVNFGQPMRVLAGEGTLRALRAMRQKTMLSMSAL